MVAKKPRFIVTLLLMVVLGFNLVNIQAVRAQEETPTEPPAPTEVVTQVATEAPVQDTATPAEAVPASETVEASPSQEPTAAATATAASVSSDELATTDIVVLDEQGQALVLGSQDAADVLTTTDPVWCPESVSAPTPGANGCSTAYPSIADLLAAMQADPQAFSQNGTIYLEKTGDQGFTTPLILDDSNESLGTSFNNLNLYDLTIQGGWDPDTGSTSDQTVFGGAGAYLQVGSASNPWIGALTINSVSVTGTTPGQDNIQIFASNVELSNVTSSNSDRNGISVTADQAGTVELNNVKATNNGHIEGSEPVGSGVYIDGADTLVSVAGGSFINNARYGIEARNSSSTTLPIANLWTDQADYSPGSIVTISGNDNNLNGNNLGFIFGEAVHVYVQGPNGYTATCEATANSYGAWSCQITLWPNELAIGDYIYVASGMASGVVQSGIFSDSQPTAIALSPASFTVVQGGSAVYSVNVTMGGSSSTCTITLSVISGLPAGATATFTGGNPIDATNTNFSRTLTITTTGATPVGSHDFTVQAAKGANCQGSVTPLTTNGTLVVNGAVATNTPTDTPTSTPTDTPTSTPTDTPTLTPTDTPTITPTDTPTNTPTDTPTSTPTDTPTSTPTDTPTNTPTDTPTSTPTDTPTPTPTDTPTSTPTDTPTSTPTDTPTNTPTDTPTSTPTDTPTSTPTDTPTNTPTETPTSTPTDTPTSTPTDTPTSAPTLTPSPTAPTVPAATEPSVGRRRQPRMPASSVIVLPPAGGDGIDLDCNSVIWAFGIKLTFYNLCDQQTSVHSVGAAELPAQLPAGYSYVMGLRVDVLTNGQILSNLPAGTGIEMDFPLHGQNGDTSKILYWSDEDGDGTGEWIELSELLSRNKITEALNTSTGNELYQIIRDKASVFYPVLTTDRTGIFILVRE